MWVVLFEQIEQKAIRFELALIPSHLDKEGKRAKGHAVMLMLLWNITLSIVLLICWQTTAQFLPRKLLVS